MNRNRGKRYDDTPRLNKKKVFATIVAFIVIIMIIISLKGLFSDTTNTKEVSSLKTYFSVYDNGKWGVIDNKGNIVIKATYDEMIIIPDENKDLFICTSDVDYNNETYQTKVINAEGTKILTDYYTVEPIENSSNNEVWYEHNILKYKLNGKYGLINFDGKVLLEAEYDNIYAMKGLEKTLVIEKNGLKGIVNTSLGEIVINPEYIEITSVSENYEDGYIVKNSSNKLGIIAADKTKILEEKYDDIKNVSGNNCYVVVENGTLQIIDNTGKVILDKGFDSIEEITVDSFVIAKNGKYGILSKSGETLVEPEFEDIKFAFSNYYIAKRNNKYGIIDNSGINSIGFDYERISYIKEADFFQAERADLKTDIIDRNFKVVLEAVIISELNIDGGYLRARVDSDYKYYNFKLEEKTNKEVLVTNTLFLVKENGKYGYENKNGERIVDCIYDDAKEQNEFGYCAVNKDGKWGVLKSDGTVVLEPTENLDDYLYIDFISEWHRYNDLKANFYTK